MDCIYSIGASQIKETLSFGPKSWLTRKAKFALCFYAGSSTWGWAVTLYHLRNIGKSSNISLAKPSCKDSIGVPLPFQPLQAGESILTLEIQLIGIASGPILILRPLIDFGASHNVMEFLFLEIHHFAIIPYPHVQPNLAYIHIGHA